MRTLKKILIATILISNSYADTKQEDSILMDNINELAICSASYYIRTGIADQESAKNLKAAQMVSDFLIGLYFKELKGFNPTVGQISIIKEMAFHNLEESYRKEKKVLPFYIDKFSQCDGALVYYLKNINLIEKDIEDLNFNKRSYLLNELNIFKHNSFPVDKKFIAESFDFWVNGMNAITPTKQKEAFKKNLENKGILNK